MKKKDNITTTINNMSFLSTYHFDFLGLPVCGFREWLEEREKGGIEETFKEAAIEWAKLNGRLEAHD